MSRVCYCEQLISQEPQYTMPQFGLRQLWSNSEPVQDVYPATGVPGLLGLAALRAILHDEVPSERQNCGDVTLVSDSCMTWWSYWRVSRKPVAGL